MWCSPACPCRPPAQNTVAEQGQLTDRFTKAVDQLDRIGPEHLQARLGAIYALERLARDSTRDHPTVIEVLSAFIRTTDGHIVPQSGDVDVRRRCPQRPIAADIQAALTVLGRRDTTRDQNTQLNLHNTCLTGADLRDANLTGANLTYVRQDEKPW